MLCIDRFFRATVRIGGVLVRQAYYAWASRADVYYETDADFEAAAKWQMVQEQNGTLASTIVYVAGKYRNHPTMTIQPIAPVVWLGDVTLIRAPEGTDGLYIFPRSVPPPEVWCAWLESGRTTDLPVGPDGRTAFEAFRLNGELRLEVLWYAEQAHKVFVHLVDDAGQIIDQRDVMPLNHQYPTSLWAEGEYVTDLYDFSLPKESFKIRVGLYLPETGTRLRFKILTVSVVRTMWS